MNKINKEEQDNLEKALFRASRTHHRCVSQAIEKFLRREAGYNDVSDHCQEHKKKVE
jgi:hypothetical protein